MVVPLTDNNKIYYLKSDPYMIDAGVIEKFIKTEILNIVNYESKEIHAMIKRIVP